MMELLLLEQSSLVCTPSMHHVLWITFHVHWILYCTQQCMDPLLTCTWIWIGCMVAVAIVDTWSAYKSLFSMYQKGNRMKLTNYLQDQGYGIRRKPYHNTISGSLGSAAGCEQFVQTWEGICKSLCIGNM